MAPSQIQHASTIEELMNRESPRTRNIRRVVATLVLSFLLTLWVLNVHSFVTETDRYTSAHQDSRKLREIVVNESERYSDGDVVDGDYSEEPFRMPQSFSPLEEPIMQEVAEPRVGLRGTVA